MGRSPCCDEVSVKKGPWTTEEDKQLVDYIQKKNGHGSWRHLPKHAGLNRCPKSCRLRWTNYLRPDIKRGKFSEDEERLIIHLHSVLGNKWSAIATKLDGRTDNEIKNHWNTHLRKKLLQMGIDPVTHRRRTDLNLLANLPNLLAANQNNLWDNSALQLQANAAYLARLQLVQGLIHVLNSSSPNLNAMNLLGEASITNHQFNNLQQTHQQFEGLENGSIYHQDPARINYSLPRFQDVSNNYFQPSAESSLSLDGGSSGEHGVDVNGGTSFNSCHNNPIENSTPLLVSASPENITAERMKGVVSIDSPSTSAQPWDGVNLEDLDDDLSWKDILDQIYWSNEQ